MALRKIIKYPDGILNEVSNEVTSFDERLGILLDDMAETMRYENGIGLAAVQIGILKRIFIAMKDEDNIVEFINPEIISTEGTQIFNEGCLSIPNRHMDIKRPKSLKIRAFDRFGKQFTLEASDYLAVIICHEYDHLNGLLFIDKSENKTIKNKK